MARYKLIVEYQGTRYRGWQIQKNARTVQGEIAAAVRKVTGQSEFELYGAGRTDAGVHALFQVAHLDLAQPHPAEKLRRAVNDQLPYDIHVGAVETTRARFHARHDAVARSYLYQISTRRTAFGKKLVWWVREDLDVEAMIQASRLFPGMQDCQSFTADKGEDKSSKVLIDRVEIRCIGSLILIRVEGSHFLWKMVRRMVGVLVEVGRGLLTQDDVGGYLIGKSDRPAELTAPPSGLFLERVYYPGDKRLGEPEPVVSVGDLGKPAPSREKPSQSRRRPPKGRLRG